MDRLMKYRLITTSLLISLVIACGGGSNSSEPDPSPGPTPVIKEEFKSTLSLSEGLPVENSALDTNSPEGIWYVKASQKSNNPTLSTVSINNSDSFLVISKQENNYVMSLCSSTIDMYWLKDRQLIHQENKLTFSGSSFFSTILEDALVDTYTVDFSHDNNLKLSGSSFFSYDRDDLVLQEETNFAATKVSNATSFSSAEELVINFSSQHNSGGLLNIDDFDPEIKCISNSEKSHDISLGVNPYTSHESRSTIMDSSNSFSEFYKGKFTHSTKIHEAYYYHYALNDEFSQASGSCDDTDSPCNNITDFSFSNSSVNNSIMVAASATTLLGDSLVINLSIAIK